MQRAQTWMKRYGRPLENARWEFLFGEGSKEAVVCYLQALQWGGNTMITECQACGHHDLLEAETSSSGSYGPDLLPGTGSFRPAKFLVIVCTKCGFVHWFVRKEDLDKVRNSRHFRSYRNR